MVVQAFGDYMGISTRCVKKGPRYATSQITRDS